jgi:hypothetical protein
MVDEPGVLLGLAHAGLVATALLASALTVPAPAALVLLGATAFFGATVLPHPWSLLLGFSAWAIWTGFFEDSLGQLAVAPSDLLRLAVMVTVSLIGSFVHLGRVRRG